MENFNPNYTIIFKDFQNEVKLNLTVEYIEGNVNNKYDLTYQWEVISGNTNINLNFANPFINMNDYDNTDLEGLIIINNKLSTELIKHLVMPDNELSKIIGNGTVSDYKKRIINSLSLFWD
jgi:hypothetical protein